MSQLFTFYSPQFLITEKCQRFGSHAKNLRSAQLTRKGIFWSLVQLQKRKGNVVCPFEIPTYNVLRNDTLVG